MRVTLQLASVLHRDVSCKNVILSPSGFLALIDFDAAYNFGDPWSNYVAPPGKDPGRVHDAMRSHAPMNFETFRNSLLPCFAKRPPSVQCRSKRHPSWCDAATAL